MNPRKRPAAEPLLPLHSAKHRRTKMSGYDGGNPSASQEVGLLSRWKSFGKEFGALATETVKAMVYGIQPPSQTDERDRTCSAPHPPRVDEYRSTKADTAHHLCRRCNHIKVLNDLDAPSRMPYPPATPPNHQSLGGGSNVATLSRPDTAGTSTSHTRSGNTQLDTLLPPKRKQANGVIPRRYRNREHIYAKAHKANVQAEIKKSKEEMQMKIFKLKRRSGYTSNFTDFQSKIKPSFTDTLCEPLLAGLLKFQAKLEKLDQRDAFSPSSSMVDLRAKETVSSPRRHSYSDNDDMAFLRRAFDRAKATLNEPRPPRPFQPSLEQLRLSHRLKDEGIEQLLRPKPVPPSPLSPKEDAQVDVILNKRGVISKYAREQVNDSDLRRLFPGQWLNDEIINFYGALILGRSENCKENPPKQGVNGTNVLNVHYFSTFFWSKLKEGYDKGRLAKWTKKASIVDIFSKDIVLIPVNHSNAHWTSAAINFRRKRIESYDSMGTRRDGVFKALRAYLDAEHRNKKKKPFDFAGWEDYSIEAPQQENGYDCGVFTCQFLQGLSRGDDFVRFTQKDMPHLRRRMIWEIGHARLREEP
ncbi:hypothetical protein D9615_005189 [Tricholomella constricta]|uniref:Ubiquitin-like protease family profile domain-containing protein n=1 Tax=Tricholomella constricta TaxID=117010 RepID=A0A8H5M1J6_9AGAR|nr:hypothetical protein D9615_005189 [Tricholomella constricta]